MGIAILGLVCGAFAIVFIVLNSVGLIRVHLQKKHARFYPFIGAASLGVALFIFAAITTTMVLVVAVSYLVIETALIYAAKRKLSHA